MDRFLCIIPARGGSKGVLRKNIRTLVDKPLIAWTIDAALISEKIDKVVVSTDDYEIAEISNDYGADVIIRPAELASDTASTMEVVFHTLEYLKKNGNYIPDYVVLLQCTSPLRNESHINEAIERILHNPNEIESLISVTKEEHPPWWLRTINTEGYTERYFDYDTMENIRRQDFVELYKPNGAIYISKTSTLAYKKTFQTKRTVPYIMNHKSSIDIDTEFDFFIAEKILEQGDF